MLLAYRFGNQITASTFSVSTTGVIAHTERLQGAVDDREHPALDAAALTQLRADLEAAAVGPYRTMAGQSTSLGSSAGSFEACSAARSGLIVRNITRAPAPEAGSFDEVVLNESAAAARLLDLAHGYTEEDMYTP